MRRDEDGTLCPETLGEYRDLCAALVPNSEAVRWLDERISVEGRNSQVLATDAQMRLLLFPMLRR